MEHVTKKQLRKEIEDCKFRQIMSVEILKVVDKFKHYKNVNKRFEDAIKAIGYTCYISRGKYEDKITFRKNNVEIEVRKYDSILTWELIISELTKAEENEKYYQRKLDNHDLDIQKLQGLVKYLKDNETVNTEFYTDRFMWFVERAIEKSLKDE